MERLPAGGAMLAVAAPEDEVRTVVESVGGVVGIAAVNGPSAVVVSGVEEQVLAVGEVFTGRGVRTRRLRVSHAFHSPLMDPMLREFRDVVEGLRFDRPRCGVVSTLTGRRAGEGDWTSAEYWVRHVREAVRFSDAVGVLEAEGVRHLLEIGPDGTLAGMAGECVGEAAGTVVGALGRRDREEPVAVLEGLARMWVAGVAVDWSAVCAGGHRVDLPTYPFQRDTYWLRTGGGTEAAGELGVRAAGHELLGAAVTMADGSGVMLTGRVSAVGHPWLADREVGGAVLLPETALLDMALRAGDEVGCGRVGELTVEAPLIVPDSGAVHLQAAVGGPDEAGTRTFSLYSHPDNAGGEPGDEKWIRHATGTLSAGGGSQAVDLAEWPPADAETVDLAGLYPGLAQSGLAHGPLFQGVRAVWRRGAEILAEVALPEGTMTSGFGLHPALLDAALHPTALDRDPVADGRPWVPSAFTGVELAASGADVLRVRLEPSGPDAGAVELTAADTAGRLVARIDSVTLRPMSAESMREASRSAHSLFTLDWVPVTGQGDTAVPSTATVENAEELAALAEGGLPELVLHHVQEDAAVRGAFGHALAMVRAWLADERFSDARLLLITRRDVTSHAAVWGLIRTAQNENPGRLLLVDSDEETPAVERYAAALAAGETQLRLRGDQVLAPRLVRAAESGGLPLPANGPWHLAVREASPTADDLAPVVLPPSADEEPLLPGEVRIAVRNVGLGFRDVLAAQGALPEQPVRGLGGEAAGVVVDAGSEVTGLAPGDRVFGLVPNPVGPVARVDRRLLVRIPDGWTFADAASVPTAFLTAWMGLVELADVRPGHTVLVHAGASGIGMAAVQLARHLGAEVFATASPGKREALIRLGLDEAHVASSRSLDFREAFLAETEGRGFDVVLNSLPGKFVDASLDLLPRGGYFLHLGAEDLGEAEAAATRPNVVYRSLGLDDALPDQIAAWLPRMVELLDGGALRPLPVRSWDARRAPEAFRHLREARHVGKAVLRMPRAWEPDGTVLITGGTGTLGSLVARHLVTEHGIRHVLLVSRRGMTADGARELAADLTAAGAEPRVESCDVSDREALAGLLASIPPDRPLRAVVHTAGVVDDGVIGSLTDEQIERVIRAKVDSALNLDELTADLDLAQFVLFSSVAGVLGGAGQGNYAAANAVLDALATRRHERGLPAVSMAWGLWEADSGMTAGLAATDRARVARAGVRPIPSTEALALFDAALQRGEPTVAPVQLDLSALRARAAAEGGVPPILRDLVPAPARRAAGGETSAASEAADLRRKLERAGESERLAILTELVREQAAIVLGHTDLTRVDADQPFRDAGFDSLTAVELRNHLGAATGIRLPATMVFDFPRPSELAEHLLSEIAPQENAPGGDADPFEGEFRKALAQIPMSTFRDAGVMGILRRLVGLGDEADQAADKPEATAIAAMDVADLVNRALHKNKP
ncbi:Beta-ketoacyl-acyl-carrier-protein synthase I [Streptomyces sp. MP131-18]|nr:Beta-ketoacyl-acyl-carrier-protein synthase I [Streptomyces sp. MP131-18]